MYAIYIHDYETSIYGWLKNTKVNKGKLHLNTGIQLVSPIICDDIHCSKIWKTKNAAIKYAESLKIKMTTVRYNPEMEVDRLYRYRMTYSIQVIELDELFNTHSVVYAIDKFETFSRLLDPAYKSNNRR